MPTDDKNGVKSAPDFMSTMIAAANTPEKGCLVAACESLENKLRNGLKAGTGYPRASSFGVVPPADTTHLVFVTQMPIPDMSIDVWDATQKLDLYLGPSSFPSNLAIQQGLMIERAAVKSFTICEARLEESSTGGSPFDQLTSLSDQYFGPRKNKRNVVSYVLPHPLTSSVVSDGWIVGGASSNDKDEVYILPFDEESQCFINKDVVNGDKQMFHQAICGSGSYLPYWPNEGKTVCSTSPVTLKKITYYDVSSSAKMKCVYNALASIMPPDMITTVTTAGLLGSLHQLATEDEEKFTKDVQAFVAKTSQQAREYFNGPSMDFSGVLTTGMTAAGIPHMWCMSNMRAKEYFTAIEKNPKKPDVPNLKYAREEGIDVTTGVVIHMIGKDEKSMHCYVSVPKHYQLFDTTCVDLDYSLDTTIKAIINACKHYYYSIYHTPDAGFAFDNSIFLIREAVTPFINVSNLTQVKRYNRFLTLKKVEGSLDLKVGDPHANPNTSCGGKPINVITSDNNKTTIVQYSGCRHVGPSQPFQKASDIVTPVVGSDSGNGVKPQDSNPGPSRETAPRHLNESVCTEEHSESVSDGKGKTGDAKKVRKRPGKKARDAARKRASGSDTSQDCQDVPISETPTKDPQREQVGRSEEPIPVDGGDRGHRPDRTPTANDVGREHAPIKTTTEQLPRLSYRAVLGTKNDGQRHFSKVVDISQPVGGLAEQQTRRLYPIFTATLSDPFALDIDYNSIDFSSKSDILFCECRNEAAVLLPSTRGAVLVDGMRKAVAVFIGNTPHSLPCRSCGERIDYDDGRLRLVNKHGFKRLDCSTHHGHNVDNRLPWNRLPLGSYSIPLCGMAISYATYVDIIWDVLQKQATDVLSDGNVPLPFAGMAADIERASPNVTTPMAIQEAQGVLVPHTDLGTDGKPVFGSPVLAGILTNVTPITPDGSSSSSFEIVSDDNGGVRQQHHDEGSDGQSSVSELSGPSAQDVVEALASRGGNADMAGPTLSDLQRSETPRVPVPARPQGEPMELSCDNPTTDEVLTLIGGADVEERWKLERAARDQCRDRILKALQSRANAAFEYKANLQAIKPNKQAVNRWVDRVVKLVSSNPSPAHLSRLEQIREYHDTHTRTSREREERRLEQVASRKREVIARWRTAIERTIDTVRIELGNRRSALKLEILGPLREERRVSRAALKCLAYIRRCRAKRKCIAIVVWAINKVRKQRESVLQEFYLQHRLDLEEEERQRRESAMEDAAEWERLKTRAEAEATAAREAIELAAREREERVRLEVEARQKELNDEREAIEAQRMELLKIEERNRAIRENDEDAKKKFAEEEASAEAKRRALEGGDSGSERCEGSIPAEALAEFESNSRAILSSIRQNDGKDKEQPAARQESVPNQAVQTAGPPTDGGYAEDRGRSGGDGRGLSGPLQRGKDRGVCGGTGPAVGHKSPWELHPTTSTPWSTEQTPPETSAVPAGGSGCVGQHLDCYECKRFLDSRRTTRKSSVTQSIVATEPDKEVPSPSSTVNTGGGGSPSRHDVPKERPDRLTLDCPAERPSGRSPREWFNSTRLGRFIGGTSERNTEGEGQSPRPETSGSERNAGPSNSFHGQPPEQGHAPQPTNGGGNTSSTPGWLRRQYQRLTNEQAGGSLRRGSDDERNPRRHFSYYGRDIWFRPDDGRTTDYISVYGLLFALLATLGLNYIYASVCSMVDTNNRLSSLGYGFQSVVDAFTDLTIRDTYYASSFGWPALIIIGTLLTLFHSAIRSECQRVDQRTPRLIAWLASVYSWTTTLIQLLIVVGVLLMPPILAHHTVHTIRPKLTANLELGFSSPIYYGVPISVASSLYSPGSVSVLCRDTLLSNYDGWRRSEGLFVPLIGLSTIFRQPTFFYNKLAHTLRQSHTFAENSKLFSGCDEYATTAQLNYHPTGFILEVVASPTVIDTGASTGAAHKPEGVMDKVGRIVDVVKGAAGFEQEPPNSKVQELWDLLSYTTTHHAKSTANLLTLGKAFKEPAFEGVKKGSARKGNNYQSVANCVVDKCPGGNLIPKTIYLGLYGNGNPTIEGLLAMKDAIDNNVTLRYILFKDGRITDFDSTVDTWVYVDNIMNTGATYGPKGNSNGKVYDLGANAIKIALEKGLSLTSYTLVTVNDQLVDDLVLQSSHLLEMDLTLLDKHTNFYVPYYTFTIDGVFKLADRYVKVDGYEYAITKVLRYITNYIMFKTSGPIARSVFALPRYVIGSFLPLDFYRWQVFFRIAQYTCILILVAFALFNVFLNAYYDDAYLNAQWYGVVSNGVSATILFTVFDRLHLTYYNTSVLYLIICMLLCIGLNSLSYWNPWPETAFQVTLFRYSPVCLPLINLAVMHIAMNGLMEIFYQFTPDFLLDFSWIHAVMWFVAQGLTMLVVTRATRWAFFVPEKGIAMYSIFHAEKIIARGEAIHIPKETMTTIKNIVYKKNASNREWELVCETVRAYFPTQVSAGAIRLNTFAQLFFQSRYSKLMRNQPFKYYSLMNSSDSGWYITRKAYAKKLNNVLNIDLHAALRDGDLEIITSEQEFMISGVVDGVATLAEEGEKVIVKTGFVLKNLNVLFCDDILTLPTSHTPMQIAPIMCSASLFVSTDDGGELVGACGLVMDRGAPTMITVDHMIPDNTISIKAINTWYSLDMDPTTVKRVGELAKIRITTPLASLKTLPPLATAAFDSQAVYLPAVSKEGYMGLLSISGGHPLIHGYSGTPVVRRGVVIGLYNGTDTKTAQVVTPSGELVTLSTEHRLPVGAAKKAFNFQPTVTQDGSTYIYRLHPNQIVTSDIPPTDPSMVPSINYSTDLYRKVVMHGDSFVASNRQSLDLLARLTREWEAKKMTIADYTKAHAARLKEEQNNILKSRIIRKDVSDAVAAINALITKHNTEISRLLTQRSKAVKAIREQKAEMVRAIEIGLSEAKEAFKLASQTQRVEMQAEVTKLEEKREAIIKEMENEIQKVRVKTDEEVAREQREAAALKAQVAEIKTSTPPGTHPYLDKLRELRESASDIRSQSQKVSATLLAKASPEQVAAALRQYGVACAPQQVTQAHVDNWCNHAGGNVANVCTGCMPRVLHLFKGPVREALKDRFEEILVAHGAEDREEAAEILAESYEEVGHADKKLLGVIQQSTNDIKDYVTASSSVPLTRMAQASGNMNRLLTELNDRLRDVASDQSVQSPTTTPGVQVFPRGGSQRTSMHSFQLQRGSF